MQILRFANGLNGLTEMLYRKPLNFATLKLNFFIRNHKEVEVLIKEKVRVKIICINRRMIKRLSILIDYNSLSL